MSEMVERAAKASYEYVRITGAAALTKYPAWEELSEDQRNLYLNAQRAAIQAMREPTEGMLNIGHPVDRDPAVNMGAKLYIYQAMIDEALK